MQGIFKALSAYGAAEPENYLTESLVFVLQLLQARRPEVATYVLNRLVGLCEHDRFVDAGKVQIRTQVVVSDGRPDIEIAEGSRLLAFVEVKHDSPLHQNQLEAYLRQLSASPRDVKRLVLLTRTKAAAADTTLSASEFLHVCWYEVYDWLAELDPDDDVVRYVVADFRSFLRDKEMCMERVSWEYEGGIAALLRLTSMLEVAAREAIPNCAIRRSAGWSWRGLLLESAYFLGVRFDKPMVLVFENNLGTRPTAREELDLASTHFLALTKDEQLEAVTTFVKKSAAMVPRGSVAGADTASAAVDGAAVDMSPS